MSDNVRKELEHYIGRIENAVLDLGFSIYPQEFELVYDYATINAREAHDALPLHFFNWDHGRTFEFSRVRQEFTAWRIAEIVANSNPCRAILFMLLPMPFQLLVAAHTYAHNNCFRVNRFLNSVRPGEIFRRLQEDSALLASLRTSHSIDQNRLQSVLDAARYLMWFKNDEVGQYLTGDILRCILEHASLENWERQAVEIIVRLSDYLYPQKRTKLVNEGWAAFRQWKIIEHAHRSDTFPKKLFTDCLRYHARLLRTPHSVVRFIQNPSPYWLGNKLWEQVAFRTGMSGVGLEAVVRDIDDDKLIDTYCDDETSIMLVDQIMGEVRRIVERKVGNRQLTEQEEHILAHEAEVAGTLLNPGAFREAIKTSFGRRVSPKIVVQQIRNRKGRREFMLKHVWDGRTLHIPRAKRCLMHTQKYLWKIGHIGLSTGDTDGNQFRLCCDGRSVRMHHSNTLITPAEPE